MSTHPSLGLLASAALVVAMGSPALATGEPVSEVPIPADGIEWLDWSLERQAVDGALVGLPEDVAITIRLEDGTAIGAAGCNDYGADYERYGDAIAFEQIEMTEELCPETVESERRYFANLVAVTTAFSTGGSLVMADASGEPILEFLWAGGGLNPGDLEPIPADGIEGMGWQLDGFVVDGGDLVALQPDVAAMMRLGGGVASGDSGCNLWSAEYVIDGTALTFGFRSITERGCAGPVMEVEAAFLEILDATSSWASDGATLTLFDREGAELARFSQNVAS